MVQKYEIFTKAAVSIVQERSLVGASSASPMRDLNDLFPKQLCKTEPIDISDHTESDKVFVAQDELSNDVDFRKNVHFLLSI